MNKGGRALGMATFIMGVAIILLVFGLSITMFHAPASDFLPSEKQMTVAGLGSAVVLLLLKIAELLLMTLAGSILAGKGIYLYLASGPKVRSSEDTDE